MILTTRSRRRPKFGMPIRITDWTVQTRASLTDEWVTVEETTRFATAARAYAAQLGVTHRRLLRDGEPILVDDVTVGEAQQDLFQEGRRA